ncbi:MAG: NAD-dependent epimerase/dehydratase family protein [Clostridia bacterium]|nr:NAD-dependent epimerase/dehydratase family protein [Clostridia bacterium]
MPEKSPQASVYIVTGADGFIGREICARLCAAGARVRGLIHGRGPAVPLPAGLERVSGDLLVPETLEALFAGLQQSSAIVIHTAARISVLRRDKNVERTNIEGTRNLLAACRRHGVKRFVYFSSVDALPFRSDGAPIAEPEFFEPARLRTSYGRSKAMASNLVLKAMAEGLDAALLLPSCVIGPGDYRGGFVTSMLRLYLRGLPRLSVRGGYAFADVRDVAAAAVAAAQGSGRGCYILSGGYGSVTEVFDTMAALLGRRPTRLALPLWTMYPLAPLVSLACRLAGRQPPLTLEALRLLAAHPSYEHARAARDLGFSPRPFRTSVADAVKFIQALSGGKKQ